MGAEDNIKTIQLVYEAFGRGDVPAILDAVAQDVDWASEAAGNAAPWYGPHHGHDGVVAFFNAFGSTVEVEEFVPTSFAGNDTEVHTIVRYAGRVRATGRRVEMNLHHYFRFHEGKIGYYRGTEDTAQTQASLQA
jgi:ketosteroid isomerase-like protein